jgi:hypothetical protein
MIYLLLFLSCAKQIPLEEPVQWNQFLYDKFERTTRYYLKECERINLEFQPEFVYGMDFQEEIATLKESINNYYIWNYIPENLESCLYNMNPY